MIVRRKLAVPELPDPWCERAEVAEALRRGLEPRYRVTLLLAGAGMGKTSALAGYVRNPPGFPGEPPPLVAWYGLGPTDGDPGVFFPHLLATLQQAVPGLADQAAHIVAALGSGGLEQAAAVLCDDLDAALAGRRLILVLDDSQHLPGAEGAAAALTALVAYFPDTSQLALSGRESPQIKLARFEVREQVLAIDESRLRFGDAELRRLAGTADVATLAARTAGWPAAVTHALRGASAGNLAAPDLLYDYLAQEVLDHLEPGTLADLAALSLAGEAPEGLLDPPRLAALRALPALAGFMARAPEAPALQSIFREAVLRRVEQTWPRTRVADLCRGVADLLPDAVQAISLLLRAQAWEEAEDRLLREFDALATAGRLASVKGLVASFGAKRMGTPRLLLVLGELERRDGRFREALVLLEDAHRGATGEPPEVRGRISAGLAALYGARGEVERQRAMAEEALACLPADDRAAVASCRNVLGMAHAYRFAIGAARQEFELALAGFAEAGDMAGQVKVQHNLGFVHTRVGDFGRAIAHYELSLRLAGAAGLLPLAVTHSNLALAAVYLDRHAEAQAHLERGVALAERLDARRDKAVMLRTLGRLLLRRGEAGEAEAAFERAGDLAAEIGDRNTQIYACLGQAEVELARGDFPAAAARAERAVALAAASPDDPAAIDCGLVLAEIALRTGRLAEAAERLGPLAPAQGRPPIAWLEFRHAAIAAELAAAQGEAAQAARWSERAAALAAEYGYPGRAPAPARARPVAGEPSGTPPPALEVLALGSFEVRLAGKATAPGDWSITKTRIALAYLLQHPGGATKEALLELLYPGEDPARTAVNMVLARLRHALEPGGPPGKPSTYVLFRGGKYLLNQGVVTRHDVAVFREHLREAGRAGLAPADREGCLAAAVAGYRGPFLEGMSGSPWVEIEREGLRRAMAGAYTELLALAAGRDDWPALESAGRDLLERDPYSQEGHRAVVLALALQERSDDAVRAANAAREFLEAGPHGLLEPATGEVFDLVAEDRLTMRSARALLATS
ncbi:MAG: tetratricopeptide repeat protein [Candidatus Sericytochromatia bacterium]|nr:tetratricopeptide repeat protein [Candidatus Tanganyikabacteria bacterium]